MAPRKPAAAEAVPAAEPVPFAGGPGGEAIPEQDPAREPDAGGWFRNTSGAELTVVGAPSMTIQPDEVVFLPYTPTHGGLQPASEVVPDAAPEPAATTAADPAPLVKE